MLLHLSVFAALGAVMLRGEVLGDLPLYRHWALGALHGGWWPAIDMPWVYPVGALVPIVLPAVLGGAAYQFVWLLLLTLTNGIALWVLTDGGRRRSAYPAAWWWLAITLVLSPVAMLRLEGFTAPLVIMALAVMARRPRVAAALLSIATWVKVWPAAVLLAAVVASPRRRTLAVTAAVTSALVIAAAMLFGGFWHLDSFLTMQGQRNLQLESPLATPLLWMAIAGVPGARVYQNWALQTREVTGPGGAWLAEFSGALMLLTVLAVAALLAWVRWRSSVAGVRHDSHLLVLGSLGICAAFIVTNKVGSPQYMLWLVPIVVAGVASGGWRLWRTPLILLSAVAVATTLVFPLFYLQLIDLNPWVAGVLGARNLLLVVLLGWAVRELWRTGISASALASAASPAVPAAERPRPRARPR
ncbi:glycosyltransferase 87 family protein [Rathayibacter sp. YIM 133350]|uniref:glycosyltransferase 87 family protein n=1 Tax=Rathayibacter sp. YIM 133350 TaxID=3131992 RepID=UPI00307EF3A6